MQHRCRAVGRGLVPDDAERTQPAVAVIGRRDEASCLRSNLTWLVDQASSAEEHLALFSGLPGDIQRG